MQKTPIVFFLLLICVSFGIAQTQDSPAEGLGLRQQEKQYDEISNEDRWEIKAVYPSVKLQDDVEAVDFNTHAGSLVMKEVQRFKIDMKGAAAENERPDDDINYYLAIGYSAEHFDEEIVSIRFDFAEYTGGAHPNHWTKTLNYDLRKNKPIELDELFKKGTDYLGVISKYSVASVIKQIREMTGSDDDTGWVEEGAGPDAKNFESWNITKGGLIFNFDPYQVGPYVLGGFEAIVPYRRFPDEIRGEAFYIAESLSFVDGDPPNICRGGLWTSSGADFEMAKVLGKKNTRAYFYSDNGNCPDGENCRRSAYLVAGDEMIVQREFEGFSCVWFQPSKGAETVGWIKSDEIEIRRDVSSLPQNWVGKWSYGSNEIEIKETQGGKLHVYGTAFWQGVGDNIHVGEIDLLGMPGYRDMEIGDGEDEYDCRVKLRLVGKYLIASDNLRCGGVNVSFNGVYLRK